MRCRDIHMAYKGRDLPFRLRHRTLIRGQTRKHGTRSDGQISPFTPSVMARHNDVRSPVHVLEERAQHAAPSNVGVCVDELTDAEGASLARAREGN
jgi:hypothetical protein